MPELPRDRAAGPSVRCLPLPRPPKNRADPRAPRSLTQIRAHHVIKTTRNRLRPCTSPRGPGLWPADPNDQGWGRGEASAGRCERAEGKLLNGTVCLQPNWKVSKQVSKHCRSKWQLDVYETSPTRSRTVAWPPAGWATVTATKVWLCNKASGHTRTARRPGMLPLHESPPRQTDNKLY